MADEASVAPYRPGRPRKPRFDRRGDWVAVKPIRPSASEFLMPGDPIPKTWRAHYLRLLWKRNCIGVAGGPWTDYMLGAQVRKDVRATGEVPEYAEKVAADADPDLFGSVGLQKPDEEEASLHVNALGGGWYSIMRGEEQLARLRGADATNDWLESKGYGRPVGQAEG